MLTKNSYILGSKKRKKNIGNKVMDAFNLYFFKLFPKTNKWNHSSKLLNNNKGSEQR